MNKQIEFFESKLAFEIDAFDLHTSLNNGEQIVVIDTRTPEYFRNEHIPGAISLPYREMNPETTGDFNRDLLYVTYCQGIECNGSTKGALNVEAWLPGKRIDWRHFLLEAGRLRHRRRIGGGNSSCRMCLLAAIPDPDFF
jgi:rhodanese-related sulfurtransferase